MHASKGPKRLKGFCYFWHFSVTHVYSSLLRVHVSPMSPVFCSAQMSAWDTAEAICLRQSSNHARHQAKNGNGRSRKQKENDALWKLPGTCFDKIVGAGPFVSKGIAAFGCLCSARWLGGRQLNEAGFPWDLGDTQKQLPQRHVEKYLQRHELEILCLAGAR